MTGRTGKSPCTPRSASTELLLLQSAVDSVAKIREPVPGVSVQSPSAFFSCSSPARPSQAIRHSSTRADKQSPLKSHALSERPWRQEKTNVVDLGTFQQHPSRFLKKISFAKCAPDPAWLAVAKDVAGRETRQPTRPALVSQRSSSGGVQKGAWRTNGPYGRRSPGSEVVEKESSGNGLLQCIPRQFGAAAPQYDRLGGSIKDGKSHRAHIPVSTGMSSKRPTTYMPSGFTGATHLPHRHNGGGPGQYSGGGGNRSKSEAGSHRKEAGLSLTLVVTPELVLRAIESLYCDRIRPLLVDILQRVKFLANQAAVDSPEGTGPRSLPIATPLAATTGRGVDWEKHQHKINKIDVALVFQVACLDCADNLRLKIPPGAFTAAPPSSLVHNRNTNRPPCGPGAFTEASKGRSAQVEDDGAIEPADLSSMKTMAPELWQHRIPLAGAGRTFFQAVQQNAKLRTCLAQFEAELIDPPKPYLPWVDPHSTHNPYSEAVWRSLHDFLVARLRQKPGGPETAAWAGENAAAPSGGRKPPPPGTPQQELMPYQFKGGRYGLAVELQRATEYPALQSLSLGELCHLVQLAISARLLAYEHSVLQPVASCFELSGVLLRLCWPSKRPAHGSFSTAKAQEAIRQELEPYRSPSCWPPITERLEGAQTDDATQTATNNSTETECDLGEWRSNPLLAPSRPCFETAEELAEALRTVLEAKPEGIVIAQLKKVLFSRFGKDTLLEKLGYRKLTECLTYNPAVAAICDIVASDPTAHRLFVVPKQTFRVASSSGQAWLRDHKETLSNSSAGTASIPSPPVAPPLPVWTSPCHLLNRRAEITSGPAQLDGWDKKQRRQVLPSPASGGGCSAESTCAGASSPPIGSAVSSHSSYDGGHYALHKSGQEKILPPSSPSTAALSCLGYSDTGVLSLASSTWLASPGSHSTAAHSERVEESTSHSTASLALFQGAGSSNLQLGLPTTQIDDTSPFITAGTEQVNHQNRPYLSPQEREVRIASDTFQNDWFPQFQTSPNQTGVDCHGGAGHGAFPGQPSGTQDVTLCDGKPNKMTIPSLRPLANPGQRLPEPWLPLETFLTPPDTLRTISYHAWAMAVEQKQGLMEKDGDGMTSAWDTGQQALTDSPPHSAPTRLLSEWTNKAMTPPPLCREDEEKRFHPSYCLETVIDRRTAEETGLDLATQRRGTWRYSSGTQQPANRFGKPVRSAAEKDDPHELLTHAVNVALGVLASMASG